MAKTGQPSTGRVVSSGRAVLILDALAEGGELGTSEVARRTGLTPSTASRQLGTLVASGLVEHVPANGRYRLGMRIVRLANALLARLDVRTVARPRLEELARQTGETATLSVPGEVDAITVDFVAGAHSVQHVTQLGRPSVAHASSAGKAMLAFTGRPIPAGRLEAFTPHTITDRTALMRELDRIREQGYAVAIEERELGLSAIAAPVWRGVDDLAGIVALQGPTTRFGPAEIDAALPVLLAQTRSVSEGLGSAV